MITFARLDFAKIIHLINGIEVAGVQFVSYAKLQDDSSHERADVFI